MDTKTSVDDFGSGPQRFRDPRHGDAWTQRLRRIIGNWTPDDELVDHYRRAHFQGDPAADVLVEWMHETGQREAMALFNQALEGGLACVSNPPEALRRFFVEVEAVPAWLSRGSLVRACRAVDRASLGHGYVLFSVSLLAGYVSAGITKTLVATGELERMAPRRVAETSKFVDDVYDSRTLERCSDGFKSTIRVRLMHAFVRRKLLRGGWDTARWGVPINQADMAGTVLSFSIAYLIGLRSLGFIVPRRDREALIHLWRYVGRLLGVQDGMLAATETESLRLLWLAAASQEGPDADGRALAQALLGVPHAYRPPGRFGALVAAFDTAFSAGFTRCFVGDEAADGLGLPDTWWKFALFVIAPLNLCRELLSRALPSRARLAPRLGRAMNRYKMQNLLGNTPVKFVPRTGAAS
jgi:hypothetical protein